MPNGFNLRSFNSNYNKLKKAVPNNVHSSVEVLYNQTISLYEDLKKSKSDNKITEEKLKDNLGIIRNLTKENNNLKKDIKKNTSEFVNLQKKYADSIKEGKQKDKELEKFTTQIQQKEKEIDSYKKDNKSLNKKNDQLTQKNNKTTELYNSALEEIDQKNKEIQGLNVELEGLKKNHDQVVKEKVTYQTEIANLTSKYVQLKELYDAIKAQKIRPVATPAQLSFSFKEAMEAMRSELCSNEESPVDYIISKFDISLKTGIGMDGNDKVSFQLPKEEEISNPENLSTIQFTIKSIPKFIE